jgi:mitogen-activated protein kinase kinase kinase
MSSAVSTSSKRLSYMTELRSKRDKSDTASLMTVDQITEAVENRRASGAYGRDEELDGWTKVDSEIEAMVPTAVADDDGVEDEEDEGDDSEISEDDEEDETLNDEAAELSMDLDDDGMIRNVLSAKRGTKPFLKRFF